MRGPATTPGRSSSRLARSRLEGQDRLGHVRGKHRVATRPSGHALSRRRAYREGRAGGPGERRVAVTRDCHAPKMDGEPLGQLEVSV